MKKNKVISDIIIYLVLVSVTVAYAGIFDPYNLALYGYEPHPLLLITVILSSYRGLLFSVLGSLFSSVLYLLLIHFQVDYEVVESIFTWSYFSLPTSIFFLSIFVGLIRQTTHDRYKGFVESDKNREIMLTNIEKNQKKMEVENRELKERLVTKEDSIQSLFTISQKMTELDRTILFENFFDVLREHAHVTKCELFDVSLGKIVSSKGYLGIENSYFNSIQNDELISKAMSSKQMKSLLELELAPGANHKVVLAVPLIFDNSIWGILAIYEIPFLKFVPTTFKMIEIYGKWLSQSLTKVNAFNTLEDHVFFDSEFHIYKYEHYLERLKEEVEQAQNYNFKFTVLKLEVAHWDELSTGKRKLHKKIIIEAIRKVTKKMDVLSMGNKEREIEILILGSHERALGIVSQTRQQLDQYNYDSLSMKSSSWDYSGELFETNNYSSYFKILGDG